LVDTAGFAGDGVDTGGGGTAFVEPFERFNNELGGVVLDGDGASKLRPPRSQLGKPAPAAFPRGEFVEGCVDAAVVSLSEPGDFSTEVGEGLAVRPSVNEPE
jgi:hypothetical protein